jgi:hypothetical protein
MSRVKLPLPSAAHLRGRALAGFTLTPEKAGTLFPLELEK